MHSSPPNRPILPVRFSLPRDLPLPPPRSWPMPNPAAAPEQISPPMSASASTFRTCPGTLPRRGVLRAGGAALAGLSLGQLLRAESAPSPGATPRAPKSLIVLWLWGGISHMETFDLKPQAPAEYRGEFAPIPTVVPGLEISEHLPRLASCADRFSLLRSVTHDSNGHVNSTHTLLTGYPGEPVELAPFLPRHPDLWSVASKYTPADPHGAPAHVAMPRIRYNGSAYLGGGLDPFLVTADPNTPEFSVPNLALNGVSPNRFTDRLSLQQRFDQFRRQADQRHLMDSIDLSDRAAVALLTGDRVRSAFDLSLEDHATRERFGRHAVGQQCLLARRLVEAGVRLVSIDFPCVPGQKAFSWDDHASVWNIFEQMKIRLPVLDQVVSALVNDLHDRGLANDVLFLVTGEMSHTPRLSNHQGQPGREHWGRTMTVFASGGGLRMGQVIGSSGPKGDEPTERPLQPTDLLATWYRHLGVPLDLQPRDFGGRPTPLLPHGRPIAELL